MATAQYVIDEFNELVEQLKSKGYKIYTRKSEPNDPKTYGYIVREDKKFCYFQVACIEGISFLSVCIPSYKTGTGRLITIDLNPPAKLDDNGTIIKAFVDFAIDLNFGTKWPSFDAFRENELMKWKSELIER